MKLNSAYDNNKLVEALKDRDYTYEQISIGDYTDEELHKISNIQKLNQFQKDLLYLCSNMSVYKVADLYSISGSYIYKHLKIIKQILNEK